MRIRKALRRTPNRTQPKRQKRKQPEHKPGYCPIELLQRACLVQALAVTEIITHIGQQGLIPVTDLVLIVVVITIS